LFLVMQTVIPQAPHTASANADCSTTEEKTGANLNLGNQIKTLLSTSICMARDLRAHAATAVSRQLCRATPRRRQR
jgi:hypothetical protein